MIRSTVAILILAAIAGCSGGGLAGSYRSEIRETGNLTKERFEQLRLEPEQMLILGKDGTFTTTRGPQTVWKGRWKSEAGKIMLRAEEVNGTAVRLQRPTQLIDEPTWMAGNLSLSGR